MKIVLLSFFSMTLLQAMAQDDEAMIRKVLEKQNQAWNKGDLDSFMVGYWENDSLMFVGKSGITCGYKQTLENYKKNYPDTAAMGKLHFTLLKLTRLSDQYYHVTGKWQLSRSIGDIGGHFTLLFRKINGRWVIISDHSS